MLKKYPFLDTRSQSYYNNQKEYVLYKDQRLPCSFLLNKHLNSKEKWISARWIKLRTIFWLQWHGIMYNSMWIPEKKRKFLRSSSKRIETKPKEDGSYCRLFWQICHKYKQYIDYGELWDWYSFLYQWLIRE